jgi:MarR family transcriptional regulator, organic hydroperoxide resistance regulator
MRYSPPRRHARGGVVKRAQGRGVDRLGAEREEIARRPLGPVLSFMRALWGVNHGLESTSRRMKVRIGVTGPERIVIRLVGRYAGISAGELARILRVHPSTLTGLVKRLSRRGLLVRRVDPADARRALLTLTAKGAGVDAARQGTVEAAVTSALDALSPRDVRAAVTVLDALARAMER